MFYLNRFSVVLVCLIFSVLSTIDTHELKQLADQVLFYMVSWCIYLFIYVIPLFQSSWHMHDLSYQKIP